MKLKSRILVVLTIVAVGFLILFLSDQFFVTGQGPVLKTELEARHEEARNEDEESSGELPEIDFPLLDQARSLDLIDMELDFPESLTKLDGRRVSLVGFMAPFDSLDDMQRCMMVPSYVGCNFCSPPSLTQVVYINQGNSRESMRPYPFIEEPSYVTGIFRLALPESEHEGAGQGFIYSVEDAVVTPYTGDAPKRAAGHEVSGDGQAIHQPGTALPSLEIADLVKQVAEIIGRDPLFPIEIESISSEEFGSAVRERLEMAFPESSRAARVAAFSLLGMIPENFDWIGALTDIELARRAAFCEPSGERILLLDSVERDHPHVRLDLVGAIADAITCQHFPSEMAGTEHEDSKVEDDDSRRALQSLRSGIRTMAVYRYSRARGISPTPPLPTELSLNSNERVFNSVEFELWQSLPRDVGPFFVDFLIGATGPFSGADIAMKSPPSTTIEFFRPRWYEDSSLWKSDPIPADFAEGFLDSPPALTDVYGLGGLVPWLVQWYPVESAKSIAGMWAGDRWAVWMFPDGGSALILETRWQDEESAIQFCEVIPDLPKQVIPPYTSGSRTVWVIRASSADALKRLMTESSEEGSAFGSSEE